MEIKETPMSQNMQKRVFEDTEYFKYIFKKTEKMSCAVFYILRSGGMNGQRDSVVHDLEEATRTLLNLCLETLKETNQSLEDKAVALMHTLIVFESKLRLANAARIIGSDLLEVFIHEIGSVERSLKRYTESSVRNPYSESVVSYEPVREKKLSSPKVQRMVVEPSTVGVPTDGGILSRRERVLMVLRDKGEATIKDIVEVVKDCSEKTIQRELISLIKDSVVSREGERRWSKYKLV